MNINLVNRYCLSAHATKEEVDNFNKFYDLEEARLNHEEKMQIEWAITDFMERMFN